jgi:beta-galactosidase
MARFVTYIVEYTKDLLHENGGPIILLQIENEYGLSERQYGQSGHKYAQWAADFAQSLNASKSTPWFMCQQDNIPSILNACNGFYCDDWVSHRRPYKNQPGMWTENWTGWFMSWGDIRPARPAKDLAFAILRFIARGGTYVGHYMWYGGTNFGRSAGVGITTDYDYDAPLDQYGFKAEPKYSHLKRLHHILADFEWIITGDYKWESRGKDLESHTYGDFARSQQSIMFLSNFGDAEDVNLKLGKALFNIPKWSVSIIQGPVSSPKLLYNSAAEIGGNTEWVYEDVKQFTPVNYVLDGKEEPAGIWNPDSSRFRSSPLEQISTTRDKTDYLWYVLDNVDIGGASSVNLQLKEANDHVYVFWNGKLVGAKRGGTALKFEFSVDPSIASNKLQILTQTLGLTNFGAHRQNWKRGITDSVILNRVDVTDKGWTHQVGLYGEKHKYFALDQSADFTANVESDVPLRWYRIQLPTIENIEGEDVAFALDLGEMGKGHVWMNGFALGRYWNITGSLPGQPTDPYPKPGGLLPESVALVNGETCGYAGTFNPDKCRDKSGIDQPTQRYYHVPKSWLNRNAQGGNTIVLFEETGGKPEKVRVVTVQRKLIAKLEYLKLQ